MPPGHGAQLGELELLPRRRQRSSGSHGEHELVLACGQPQLGWRGVDYHDPVRTHLRRQVQAKHAARRPASEAHDSDFLFDVVLGYGAFALNKCEVKNCEFTFAGPAASVIQTMATIYHSLGEQGKNLIEGTFEQVRNAAGNKPA